MSHLPPRKRHLLAAVSALNIDASSSDSAADPPMPSASSHAGGDARAHDGQPCSASGRADAPHPGEATTAGLRRQRQEYKSADERDDVEDAGLPPDSSVAGSSRRRDSGTRPVSRGPGTKASHSRQILNTDVIICLRKHKNVYALSPQHRPSNTSISGSLHTP